MQRTGLIPFHNTAKQWRTQQKLALTGVQTLNSASLAPLRHKGSSKGLSLPSSLSLHLGTNEGQQSLPRSVQTAAKRTLSWSYHAKTTRQTCRETCSYYRKTCNKNTKRSKSHQAVQIASVTDKQKISQEPQIFTALDIPLPHSELKGFHHKKAFTKSAFTKGVSEKHS